MSTCPGISLKNPFYFKLKDGRSFFVESFVSKSLEVNYSLKSVSSKTGDSVTYGTGFSYECTEGKEFKMFDGKGKEIPLIESPTPVALVAHT
jgi:hypothetical protein